MSRFLHAQSASGPPDLSVCMYVCMYVFFFHTPFSRWFKVVPALHCEQWSLLSENWARWSFCQNLSKTVSSGSGAAQNIARYASGISSWMWQCDAIRQISGWRCTRAVLQSQITVTFSMNQGGGCHTMLLG